MKKILLAILLCVTPFFSSHAAEEVTELACTAWQTFRDKKTNENFDALKAANNSMAEIFKAEERYGTGTAQSEVTDPKLKDSISKVWEGLDKITTKCSAAAMMRIATEADKKTKERMYKNITLFIEDLLNRYKHIESRSRMPFVHHGDVLPGPGQGESTDYVEKQFIPKFVNGMLILLMSLSVLMIIIGGLMFVFSSGDSELTTRAKTTILWAIVGVVLTILSYAIVQFIIGIDFTL